MTDTTTATTDSRTWNPTSTALSDLFFNYEHPARDRLYRERDGGDAPDADEDGFTEDELLAALTEDAEEFLRAINLYRASNWLFPEDVTPAQLAADFIART